MPGFGRAWVCLGLIAVFAASASHAGNTLSSDPVVSAVNHSDCRKAVDALNAAVDAQDAQHAFTLFIGGRMLDEGICTDKDPASAARYFSRSASLGNLIASLDYAASIGLGVGATQDYASAGRACHDGGMDPQGSASLYSLGYACTIRAVAGRLIRISLPKGAFRLPTPPAVVEFNPVSSQFRIVSVPGAKQVENSTGSMLAPQLVYPSQAITRVWQEAQASVPQPDKGSLSNATIRLTVDIDATLEGGTQSPYAAKVLPADAWPPLQRLPQGGSGPH